MKFTISTLFIGFYFFVLSGQNIKPYDIEMQAKHAELKGYDPEYRVNYFENIILKTFIDSDVASFQYRTLSGDNEFNIVPAAEYLMGISLDYKWIAVGVSFSPKFLESSDFSDLSNSESIKVEINFFYSDQWRQELSYTYLNGFLNKNEQSSSLSGLRVLDNTSLSIFHGSTFYIANNNFSFRSHYAQTERQLKSAGSFIPKLTYSYSITDPNISSPELDIETLKLKSIDIIGQVGYLYTFVTNQKWYATIGLHPGLGYNSAKYNLRDESDRLFSNTLFALDGELALGYNDYRWFFGLTGSWRNYNRLNNENQQISRDSEYFEVHFGYRFNDNKPMRKFFGWFEDHLGF